ncbi:hypothetical protein MASR2M29_00980 [Spirochaetota bacterium]
MRAALGFKKDMFRRLFLCACFCSLALCSCRLDYGTGLDKDLSEEIPDTVVYDFVHTVAENGSPRFNLKAKRAESYQAKKLMRLYSVSFIEYAGGSSLDQEQILSEGKADRAVFYTDTESAELSGSVYLYSAKEKSTIRSSYLEWNGESRILSSRADAVSSIYNEEGSGISGSGFGVDANRRSFGFDKHVDGQYSNSDTGIINPDDDEPGSHK